MATIVKKIAANITSQELVFFSYLWVVLRKNLMKMLPDTVDKEELVKFRKSPGSRIGLV